MTYFPEPCRTIPNYAVPTSRGRHFFVPVFQIPLTFADVKRRTFHVGLVFIPLHTESMQTTIMRVVQQGQFYTVQSQKTEGGQLAKCSIVLQELGGKYSDQFVAVLLGDSAATRFEPGQLVAVSLRFSTKEYNGQHYQDIIVNEIMRL